MPCSTFDGHRPSSRRQEAGHSCPASIDDRQECLSSYLMRNMLGMQRGNTQRKWSKAQECLASSFCGQSDVD